MMENRKIKSVWIQSSQMFYSFIYLLICVRVLHILQYILALIKIWLRYVYSVIHGVYCACVAANSIHIHILKSISMCFQERYNHIYEYM